MRRSINFLVERLPDVVDEELPLAVRCHPLSLAYRQLAQRTRALSSGDGYITLNKYRVVMLPSDGISDSNDGDDAIGSIRRRKRPFDDTGILRAPLGSVGNPIVLFDDDSSLSSACSRHDPDKRARRERFRRTVTRVTQGLDVIIETLIEANEELLLACRGNDDGDGLLGKEFERHVGNLNIGGKKLKAVFVKLLKYLGDKGIQEAETH